MRQHIRIELEHSKESGVRSWIGVAMEARASGSGPAFEMNLDAASAYRSDLSRPVQQVLSSEIQAGMLMGLKQAKNRDWKITLLTLGATRHGEDAVLSAPSDGFAVAATLAVAHGSGAEDLTKDPHGGYSWKLSDVQISEA